MVRPSRDFPVETFKTSSKINSIIHQVTKRLEFEILNRQTKKL